MSSNTIWTCDLIEVLDGIRINCVLMSVEHKKKYIYLKGILRYFKIPIIVLSSLNSVFSVSLSTYLEQSYISLLTCGISLVCAILSSVELYLQINAQMEQELIASKEYYILSTDIYKMLTVSADNRSVDGLVFLESCYGTYIKLIENSNCIKINDKLTVINKENITNSCNSSINSISNELII